MTSSNTPADDCYNCEQAGRELDAFVRGELPLESVGRMQEHLSRCRDCANVVCFEKAFRERLRRAGSGPECPEALRQKVREILARARNDA